jgi:hypothetical protein
MTIPQNILAAIEEALQSVDEDIQARLNHKQGTADLDKIKKELLEIKAGTRKSSSREMSHMIIDSMDWEQPCLKKFYYVDELLAKHYKIKH